MSKIAARALQIFSAFSINHPYLSFEQLVKKTEVPKSTLYRFLRDLLESGYLSKNQNGFYYLGPGILQLGRIAEAGCAGRTLAVPWIPWLWEKTGGETVSLWIRFGDSRLCVDSRERQGGGIKFSSYPGETRPIYAGAAGKVLLAYMNKSEAIAVLKRVSLVRITCNTVINREDILKQLSNIRNQGYAYSEGEANPGAFALSAPLLNSRGLAEAALTITGVLEPNKKPAIDKFCGFLLEATGNISKRMGFTVK